MTVKFDVAVTGMFQLFLQQQDRADEFRFGREADGGSGAP